MHRYFPLTTIDSWNDWKWQLRNAFTSIEDLKKIMKLSDKEVMAINNLKGTPLRITPRLVVCNTKFTSVEEKRDTGC
jgi:L-lysine 2,3-aminomutase